MPKLKTEHVWQGLLFYPPREEVKDRLQCQWLAASVLLCVRGETADSLEEKQRARKRVSKVLGSVRDHHRLVWPGANIPMLVPASARKSGREEEVAPAPRSE